MSKNQACNQAELNKLSNYQVTLSRGTCNSVKKPLDFYGIAFKQFMSCLGFLCLCMVVGFFKTNNLFGICKLFIRALSRLMIVQLAISRGVFLPSADKCTEMRNK